MRLLCKLCNFAHPFMEGNDHEILFKGVELSYYYEVN